MKYVIGMGSGVTIHTKFHKDWCRHSKVDRGDTQTYRQQGDLISLVLCHQNMKSGQIEIQASYNSAY
jgi:hypothetical protein